MGQQIGWKNLGAFNITFSGPPVDLRTPDPVKRVRNAKNYFFYGTVVFAGDFLFEFLCSKRYLPYRLISVFTIITTEQVALNKFSCSPVLGTFPPGSIQV